MEQYILINVKVKKKKKISIPITRASDIREKKNYYQGLSWIIIIKKKNAEYEISRKANNIDKQNAHTLSYRRLPNL